MFCLKKRMIAVALVGMGISVGAMAQTSAERVRQMNEEIAILDAQLKKLELEAKIAGKEVEKQRSSAAPSPAFGNQATEEMPVVRAIDGMDGKLVATLGMRGGMTQTVREGEKFGAWTIKAITVSSVTLARGKEIARVPFGNDPPFAANNVGASGLPTIGGAGQPPGAFR